MTLPTKSNSAVALGRACESTKFNTRKHTRSALMVIRAKLRVLSDESLQQHRRTRVCVNAFFHDWNIKNFLHARSPESPHSSISRLAFCFRWVYVVIIASVWAYTSTHLVTWEKSKNS